MNVSPLQKKRVGNVKGIDKKPPQKPKISPTGGKGKVGIKIVQKFRKGGMVKGKKGC